MLAPPLTAACDPFVKLYLQIFNTVPDMPLTNAQLHLSRKKSSDSKPPSCSERPLTLFHTMQSAEKRESPAQGQQGAHETARATFQLLRVHTSGLSLWVPALRVLEDGVWRCPHKFHC